MTDVRNNILERLSNDISSDQAQANFADIPEKIYNDLSDAFTSNGLSHVQQEFCNSLVLRLQKEAFVDAGACLEIIRDELSNARLFGVLENMNGAKMEDEGSSINCKNTIEEYTSRSDWRVNANANVGFNNLSLVNQISGKVIANYWLDCIYSKDEGEAHRNADIHIHDLDCLTGYCAGWSLRALLNEGFNGVVGRVASGPPNHLREALGQMYNFLGILQSEWAGAQAFSSFDTYLAPYVFKDNLSFKDIKKAIRSFVYNLNVPTRGGQSPFTNVTLDFSCPKDLRDQIPTKQDNHLFSTMDCGEEFLARVRERGVESPTEMTYKHFQKEMELIDIAYYHVMTEGDSRGQPFTFPFPTVNITPEFDWDSPAADALFENSAKVGCSYFQNFVGSQWMKDENGNKIPNPDAFAPDAVRSMCCRLQLDLRELIARGNCLFGSAEMTGSIGVVTLNMARLGYLFKGDKEGFYNELGRLMDLSKSLLEKKRVFVQDMYNRGLYPYTKRYLRGFQNHFSTIGINGIHEMLLNFTDNKIGIQAKEGIDFCLEIMTFMREKLRGYQNETGNLYNLEATPAESTTYRFAKEDKKRFRDIVQSGFGESVYYTNSSQLPADFTEDPYAALEKQEDLQCKYNGGTTLHLYMSEKLSSPEACKRFVKSVVSNYKLPSFTVTPIFSVCEEHGYLNGEQKACPECGKKTTVWTRVMGYYRPVDGFNIGKKQEHAERQYFGEPDYINKARDEWNEQLSLKV